MAVTKVSHLMHHARDSIRGIRTSQAASQGRDLSYWDIFSDVPQPIYHINKQIMCNKSSTL